MALEKVIKLKHGVTELGNLQVYLITEIIEDGKIISSNIGKPYTPKDVNNMEDFDAKSKEIVSAITDESVKANFEVEKKVKTDVGIEKIITYDRIIEDDGKIAVRQVIRIFDNGKEISKKFHRSWINPGDEIKGDIISKAVAVKIHTSKVISDYKLKQKKPAEKI